MSMHATTSPVLVLFAIYATFFLTGSDGRSCLPAERHALLAFKKGITSDPASRLSSWHGQDCCQWRGVRCSNETGHVLKLQLRNQNLINGFVDGCHDVSAVSGEISPSLLSLEHLEHLDLSMNCFTGKVPSFLGSMKMLRYLNLSGLITFSGEVPPQLGNLSRLQYLDLGSPVCRNYDIYSRDITWLKNLYSRDIIWLKNLPMLQYLSMSCVDLSRISDWPHVLNNIPSLKVIDLSSCTLGSANQSIPYLNLTKLEVLDLSGNLFQHEIASCWFWKVTSLRCLYISDTGLFGQLYDALENMAFLQILDLSNNSINLVMKGNFKNLCFLKILYLFRTGMNGDIAELMELLSHSASDTLQELHLDYNNFIGALPNLIGRFTSLTLLDLSFNNITGSIPPQLANCSSVITEKHLAGLTSLKKVDLSSNNLKIVIDKNWHAPFNLKVALFKSCQIGPQFPIWLQQQLEITTVDLSRSGLMGKIPDWFWPTFSQATYIDISGNKLNGSLPAHLGGMAAVELYLGSNMLTGLVPQLPRNISVLDISNNSFSGTLPSDLEAHKLQTMLMYSNQISGTIPGALCKSENLIDLDMSNNLFEGEIPQCVHNELFGLNIEFLLLSNNSLTGVFPVFLQNSLLLQFLDLSRNKFFGNLPPWIGNFGTMYFIKLSHNTFSGNIPDEITNLSLCFHIG